MADGHFLLAHVGEAAPIADRAGEERDVGAHCRIVGLAGGPSDVRPRVGDRRAVGQGQFAEQADECVEAPGRPGS